MSPTKSLFRCIPLRPLFSLADASSLPLILLVSLVCWISTHFLYSDLHCLILVRTTIVFVVRLSRQLFLFITVTIVGCLDSTPAASLPQVPAQCTSLLVMMMMGTRWQLIKMR
ncbi:hypothetical protein CPC08DRAFT_705767 [Agrocybe pediades]|nr:hypothetical protein CPC08DRAFT_705767 [Agrocybe pediades]